MSPTRIEELARATADGTQIVDQYFPNSTIVTPSFGTNGPSTIIIPPGVPEIAAAHATVTDATKELHSLMLGPVAFWMNTGLNDVLSFHGTYHYKIASAFPADEETSFKQNSSACGLNEPDLRRLLRHAMTNHIFQESQNRVVAHCVSSKLLAENPLINDFVGMLS